MKTIAQGDVSTTRWRLNRVVGQAIQKNCDQRPYVPPRDSDCVTPSIIPEKIVKTKIGEMKNNIEEIANELLEICENELNLPIERFYLGGALYSETYSAQGLGTG